MPDTESLVVAQVASHPPGTGHPVAVHVERLSRELAARGHRVVILAPSGSPAEVHETRRRLRDEPEGLVPEPGGAPVLLAVGEALPAITDRGGPAHPSVDVARAVGDVLDALPLDLLHVHDPFGPSLATAALRRSRVLSIATAHVADERGIGPATTALAPRRAARILGRVDARLATSGAAAATANALHAFAGGWDPTVPPPAVDVAPGPDDGHRADDRIHLVLTAEEERPAQRILLRALRRLDPELPWRATIVVARGDAPTGLLRPDLQERVRYVPEADLGGRAIPADADVVLLGSSGAAAAPHVVVEALHAGVVPVASGIDVHEELLDHGRLGPLFDARDPEVLTAQVERLVADPERLAGLRAAGTAWARGRTWDAYTATILDAYARVRGRRHDPHRFDPAVIARLRDRPTIAIDLHMHTDHSHDCATPVEVLLDTARRQGLGAIAVTDHNEISGALEAQEKADRFGVKVIVGEEVKTADQGEVIGLFLTERIPKGVTFEEAIADIRRQGGVVYVPHPFDRMHSVPDYEHLLPNVEDVDALEVFNPRVAIGSFNAEAERFAAKYRIVAGAGSDSHVAQGLGSVRNHVPDFDGPEEFLAALSMARIETKPGTLVYVQALKFLETVATPPGARRRVRERRVRRATRR